MLTTATVPSSLDGTVAARLRYRLDGMVASVFERIMELLLLRTFAPGSKSTMVWNFHSLELSLPGAKVLGTFQELSLQGTFAPWNFFAPTPSDFRS